MAAAGAQHLFGRPQRIAAPGGAHDGEMSQIDPCRGERGRVRQVRRREPHDALARGGERGERRQHELKLADAFAVRKDLGQRPGGPAAAGQLMIEDRETRWHGRRRLGEGCAAPDRMPLENFF